MTNTHLSTTATATLLLMGALAHLPTAHAAAQGTATKSGWWVKIATDKTDAESIAFELGKRERDHEEWRHWTTGEPAEFDVPEAYRDLPRLYFRATSLPGGKRTWLCLMYKDHGVKHLDIDSTEAQMKAQTDTDEECK